ncbi:hypothetical protein [Terribacillus saccharophilus]|uniref:hypothetical protein n=1 Tax=Terribacillus saccharophilus TaxID=361277 RepID=UPI003981D455
MNLDLDDFPISAAWKQRIESWAEGYGEWLDLERDELQSDAVKAEENFNREGSLLSIEIQKDLPGYFISYKASHLSSLYK